MNIFNIGDSVRLVVGPDKAEFAGVLTDWDNALIYVNGLGYPRDDIVSLNPDDEI